MSELISWDSLIDNEAECNEFQEGIDFAWMLVHTGLNMSPSVPALLEGIKQTRSSLRQPSTVPPRATLLQTARRIEISEKCELSQRLNRNNTD